MQVYQPWYCFLYCSKLSFHLPDDLFHVDILCLFLEETQTTCTWGKVISRWIGEFLGLAALLENSDVVFIETFIDNQVSEIVLLSPQFFQVGLSLNSFPAFFKILNFLVNPLKVQNSEFFAMKFIHMTCQFLQHSSFFLVGEGAVTTAIRFSVFIQGDLNFDLPKKFSIELALSCFLDLFLHYKFHFLIVHFFGIRWSCSWLVTFFTSLTDTICIRNNFFGFSNRRTALLRFWSCSFQWLIFRWVFAAHNLIVRVIVITSGSESIARRGGRIFTRIFSCSTRTRGLRFFVAWALFGDGFFAFFSLRFRL